MLDNTEVDCSLLGTEIHPPANASLQLDNLKEPFIQTIAAVQLCISFLGIVGNILSLVVLATTKALHTTPNLYIGVLAAVDLVICLIIPVSTVQILIESDSDTIPPALCKAIGCMIMISLSGSLFCMMLVAVNRYILIVKGRATYNRIYTKTNSALSIILVFLWLMIIVVIIPETTGFGHFGYNAKFGTCILISYCFVNYIYTVALVAFAIFVPVSIVTGRAYFCIIRKLLVIRRKIELGEKIMSARPSAITEDFAAKDSGVEMSQVLENVEDGDGINYADFEEMGEIDYRVDVKSDSVGREDGYSYQRAVSATASERKSPVPTLARPRTENYELIISDSATEQVKYTVEVSDRDITDVERRPSKSFIRRLSPPKLRIRSPKAIAKLRRPQWRKLCLAIANMITIYVVMWVCWSPMIFQYIIDMHGRQPAYSYKIEVTFVYLNSAFNVLLYAIMNTTHRKAYIRLLKKCFAIK